jgi:leukotriene-A4 hydrolase
MEYDLTLAEQAYALAERWNSSRSTSDVSQLHFKESDLEEFDSNQISMNIEIPYALAAWT